MARTYRLSEADRRERAERMRRLGDDPVVAAARRAGAKRYWADPKSAAMQSERIKRVFADPKCAAAHRERMKRLHTNPEFVAKLAATNGSLPSDKRAAIIAALTVNPNANQVAKETGVCPSTVRKLAKRAGIRLPNRGCCTSRKRGHLAAEAENLRAKPKEQASYGSKQDSGARV